MRYLSVCSGIEAATVAWHPLGWTPVAFSEIEPFPAAVLAHHYPDVPNRGDMTRFKEWPDESIDVLVGGTPCQAFSVAGLRKGLDDPRGGLMLVYLQIAACYRPRWVVWENVPGVLSIDGGRAFGALLGGLAELGYGFSYRILDAQFFGVAQRRRRVFVVGYLGDWRRAAAVLFERHSLSGNPAPRREARQGTAGGAVQRITSGSEPDLMATLCAKDNEKWGCNQWVKESKAILEITHSLRGTGFDASEDGTGRGTPLVLGHRDIAPTLTSNYGKQVDSSDTSSGPMLVPVSVALRGRDGGATAELGDEVGFTVRASSGGGDKPHALVPMAFHNRQDPDISGDITHPLGAKDNGMAVCFDTTQITCKANYSNPQPGDPCHPLAAGAHAPAIAGAMQVRRLTPVECERLQGFPDHYTDIKPKGKPTPDGPRYKALGNSMAVPVMHWIGRRIQIVESMGLPEWMQ